MLVHWSSSKPTAGQWILNKLHSSWIWRKKSKACKKYWKCKWRKKHDIQYQNKYIRNEDIYKRMMMFFLTFLISRDTNTFRKLKLNNFNNLHIAWIWMRHRVTWHSADMSRSTNTYANSWSCKNDIGESLCMRKVSL